MFAFDNFSMYERVEKYIGTMKICTKEISRAFLGEAGKRYRYEIPVEINFVFVANLWTSLFHKLIKAEVTYNQMVTKDLKREKFIGIVH